MQNTRAQKLQWSGPTVHSSTVAALYVHGSHSIEVLSIGKCCGMFCMHTALHDF